MLVLSRMRNESIRIGGNIRVSIVDIRGDKVRLGITAPRDVSVHREEIQQLIDAGEPDRKAPLHEIEDELDWRENQGFTGLDMSELPRSAEEMLDGSAAETARETDGLPEPVDLAGGTS